MPRGRRYTEREDAVITEVFHNFRGSPDNVMREHLSIRGVSGRSIAAYGARYRRLELLMDNNFRTYARALPSPHYSRVVSEESINRRRREWDDAHREPPPPPQIARNTVAPPGSKRKFSEMSLEELDKYEELYGRRIENINKRRKELEEEMLKRDDPTLPSCAICKDDEVAQCVITKCNHTFCTQCTLNLLCQPLPNYSQRNHNCPLCRTELNGVNAAESLKTGTTNGEIYRRIHKIQEPINVD